MEPPAAELNDGVFDATGKHSKLLDLPCELVQMVLEKLPLRDIMNFRVTCRKASEHVSASSHRMRSRFPNIWLTLDSSNHKTKLQIIKTSMFPYTGVKYTYDVEIQDLAYFAREYGSFIKGIHLKKLNVLVSEQEYKCIELFVCLESISVERLDCMRDLYEFSVDGVMPQFKLPKSVFDKVAVFKFQSAADAFAPHFVLRHCPNLRKLVHGFIENPHKLFESSSNSIQRDIEVMENLVRFLKMKLGMVDIVSFKLEFSDNFHASRCYGEFRDFADIVSQLNVCIKGIPVEVLLYIYDYHQELWGNLSLKVHSVRGICPQFSRIPLVALSEVTVFMNDDIDIESGSESESAEADDFEDDFNGFESEEDNRYQEVDLLPEYIELPSNGGYAQDRGMNWPTLEKIKVHATLHKFNQTSSNSATRQFGHATKYLLGTRRYSVKKVDLRSNISLRYSFLLPHVLCTKFPNIVELRLQLPFYAKSDIADLFRILGQETAIVKLRLYFNTRGNEDIVQGNFNQGATFRLMSRLKHFFMSICSDDDKPARLKSLLEDHAAGNIQDFYTDVLAGTLLSCLSLENCFPVNSVGVDSLINGAIGQTLCSFKLDHCSNFNDVDSKLKFEASLESLKEQTYTNACRSETRNKTQHGVNNYGCSICKAFR